jgi:branched-chain amino acid transport system substrate-binding protein
VPALEGARPGDGVLELGLLVPIGRPESIYQPAIQAGFELAVAEVNSLGGVLGEQIVTNVLDAGDATDGSAVANAQQLVTAGVDAIVGPATSAVTAAVLDTVTAAGVVLFSPSSTAAALTGVADRGLFFRNIPSDVLQGDTLARVVAERGNQTVFVITRDDLYGVGLATQLQRTFESLGVRVVGSVVYPTDTESFTPVTQQVRAADPDAIVIVSFEEGARLLRSLVVAGLGPRQKQVFGGDGSVSNTIGELFALGA